MSRTFAYCRVSTTEQTTENQILAIHSKGYEIDPARVIQETISGTVPAMKRPKFAELVNSKLERGDRLIVLKLDRLGRNNIDVQNTINDLQARGVDIVCLDLPEPQITTASGRFMLQMFSAFAEFERARIVERTLEGLARARAQGKKLGHPGGSKHAEDVQRCKANGLSQSKTAAELKIGIATVKRHWNTAA